MEKRLVRFLSPLTFLNRKKGDRFNSGSGDNTNKCKNNCEHGTARQSGGPYRRGSFCWDPEGFLRVVNVVVVLVELDDLKGLFQT